MYLILIPALFFIRSEFIGFASIIVLFLQGVGHEGIRPQRAIFVNGDKIFTTGFTKRSERLYALRSQENLGTPIVEEELDTSMFLIHF